MTTFANYIIRHTFNIGDNQNGQWSEYIIIPFHVEDMRVKYCYMISNNDNSFNIVNSNLIRDDVLCTLIDGTPLTPNTRFYLNTTLTGLYNFQVRKPEDNAIDTGFVGAIVIHLEFIKSDKIIRGPKKKASQRQRKIKP